MAEPSPVSPTVLANRVRSRLARWKSHQAVERMARIVAQHARPTPGQAPVVVFNSTARLGEFSLNAAFSLLSSWSLRLAGAPVIHFASRAGMSRCVLATNPDDPAQEPPCDACSALSDRLYTGANVRFFHHDPHTGLREALQGLGIQALESFTYPLELPANGSFDEPGEDPPGNSRRMLMPLGSLVLPALRWALRRHHLVDDEPTRFLYREYLLSAYTIAVEFARLLAEARPAAALIFNGVMYPEASARWVAQQMGVRVVTHEVGFQRFSAFFSEEDATAYPIPIPDDFELSPAQNERLDALLEKRFQGQFTMAGIRFWPEMQGLDEAFLQRASRFRQIVPVFTNVVFDTSQVHANTVFSNMFAWLDLVLELIRAHPETLFVIRAHPDEMRPGSNKQSRESVQDWVVRNRVGELPNVVYIGALEYISSYELIQRAKFVMVYNSSIGLEAAVMGAPVLSGGKARYTQYPIVFFPSSQEEFRRQAQAFLGAERVEVPAEFQSNARRFLYYQFFRASLSFEDFLRPGQRPGLVELRPFSWEKLLPENSPTLRVITGGILGSEPGEGSPFLRKEDL